MKTKLLKSILSIALFAMTISFQAQVYDVNPTGDGIISDVALVLTNNPQTTASGVDGTTVLKVGASDAEFNGNITNAVIPFLLPARPAGKVVLSANLKVNVAYFRHWIDTDVDLYGLPYNASNALSSSDFYDQGYNDPSATVTAIQSGFIVRDVGDTEPLGSIILTDRVVDSDVVGDAALVAYINAQYDAGAVAGDYVFLRLSINAPTASVPNGLLGAHYYGISDESTDEAPVLTIDFDNAGEPVGDIIELVYGAIEDTGAYGNKTNENGTYPSPDTGVWIADPKQYVGGLKQFESGVDASLLANYDGVAVIPFLLPALPTDKIVGDVTFSVYLEAPSAAWGTLNCDLYGIDARPAATVLASDFFAGGYGTDGTATAIQDDFIANTAVAGLIATNASGDASLKTFLQTQYDNGKAGQYVFFRINPDVANVTTYLRIDVSSADHADDANKPQISVTYTADAVAAIDNFNKQSLGLYPNPVTDGRLRVSLDGFSNNARLDIYAITGQLVHTEKIEASSRNSFETQLNLSAGLYIVKLQDGERGKTQKLIVQ